MYVAPGLRSIELIRFMALFPRLFHSVVEGSFGLHFKDIILHILRCDVHNFSARRFLETGGLSTSYDSLDPGAFFLIYVNRQFRRVDYDVFTLRFLI